MRPLLLLPLLASLAPAEVILQFFECEWDEMHRRTPEIAELGYDAVWIPSPCKSPVAGTFKEELVSLIDIVTEPDARFTNHSPYHPEPSPFVRHPGQYANYPFHTPPDPLPAENVRQMLNRWAHWLGDAIDHDGFRLDAGKHVVREFYGGPGDPNGDATRGLLDIPGWDALPYAEAAQAVQISAHPDRYAAWEQQAYAWISALG